MTVILILLGALFSVGVVLKLLHHDTPLSDNREAGGLTSTPETELNKEDNEECCGMHITCERDSLLSAISEKIEYYDDEELDRYRGRQVNEYSETEIEEFRDVLYTLLPTDIAGWARSIQLRGITLPQIIRDELLMIVAEARLHTTSD